MCVCVCVFGGSDNFIWLAEELSLKLNTVLPVSPLPLTHSTLSEQPHSGVNVARQHDSGKKFSKIQCNTNQNNMTSDVKSAISSGSLGLSTRSSNGNSNCNSQQKQHQTLINGNTTPPAMATSATAAANTSVSCATIATDTTRYKSGLSDVAADEDVDDAATSTAPSTSIATATATETSSATPAPAASVLSTGCATMPRTRQYGSNAAGAAAANSMTADKKFLSRASSAANTSASTAAAPQQHHKLQFTDKAELKLAALDNLDLAHKLDLIDDDADDPYGVLQDYLERVKVSAELA